MEEKYWDYVKTRNADGYLSLWHEDFVGWPFFAEEPNHKEDIRKSPFRRNPTNMPESVILDPKAVEFHSGLAITFYVVTVTYTRPDGTTETTKSRITHTWTKSKTGWVIISGMSAKIDPPCSQP